MLGAPALELTEVQQRALENLPPLVSEALSRFCERLLARFGDDIRRVILYGSFVRGEAHDESDVDVMVVVAWEEERLPDGWYRSPYSDPRWQAIIDIAVESTLESERYFSPLVVSETLFQSSRGDAVEEARREGIVLYTCASGITSAGKRLTRLTTSSDTPVHPSVDRALREATEDYDTEPADLDDPHQWLLLADDELRVVRDLIKDAHYAQAVSRAYYGMFYAAKAMLLAIGISVKSHKGVIAQFGRCFVETGRIEARFESILSRANEERLRSDYEPKSRPKREDVEQALHDAETFIAQAHELVDEELKKRGAQV